MTAQRGVFALSVLAVLGGCGLTSSMNVQPVAVSTQKPGHVAAYLAVSQHGAGVPGLDQHNFRVFENGALLDNSQIQLTLQPTSNAASHRAALLVDMSRALTADQRATFGTALQGFIAKLRQRQAVSVYAFDGATKVHPVAELQRAAHAELDGKDANLDRLWSFNRRDSSSSLYSAVMDASQKLSSTLHSEGRPIQSGTVIVLALNPDLTGRTPDGRIRDFMASSAHRYYLLTVGQWVRSSDVSFLGKSGAKRAASVNTLSTPLEAVASAVDDEFNKDYLLSYCSPARAGKRELKVEVTTTDDQGKKSVGAYATEFDASGFGPGCSALALPHFAQAETTPAKRVVAEPAHGSARPASNAEALKKPAASTDSVKVSSAAAASTAAPIAEPPSGLGYE